MDLIAGFIDIGFHWGDLQALAAHAGPWIYGILFVLVFSSTGIVLAPFVPGNSMLFVAGAFARAGVLNVWFLEVTLLFLGMTMRLSTSFQ